MNLQQLTRSAVVAVTLAALVAFLPGLRKLQVAEAAGAPRPLPRYIEAAVLASQAMPLPCGGRAHIVQDCTFGGLALIKTLEQQVIAELIALHKLPTGAPPPLQVGGDPNQITLTPTEVDTSRLLSPEEAAMQADTAANRLLSWERGELRALLFAKIALIIDKAPPVRTAEEKAIVDALAARVQQRRLAAATEAKRFYSEWENNPCEFRPPAGFTYERPQSCSIPNSLGAVFQNPPTLEQFQAYGAAAASGDFQNSADLQAAAAETAKGYMLAGGAAAALLAVPVGWAIGHITPLVAAITPFALKAFAASQISAGSAAAGVGATAGAFAAAAFIVVLCVTIGVIAGISIFTAEATPGKLDEAIESARTPPDLEAVIDTEAGTQEIFAAFLPTTLIVGIQGALHAGGLNGWLPVPAARPDDQKFLLEPGPSAQASATLTYKSWDNATHTAYLSHGWFVDGAAGTSRLTLDLDYLDHAGEQWSVWRFGDRFLHTTVGNAKPAFESDLIQYQDAAGAKRTAMIQAPGSAPATATPTQSPPANVVDTTAPTFTGPPSISPAANAAGWHNSDVTVGFACSDGDPDLIITTVVLGGGPAITERASGIATCGPTQSLTSEGRDQSVTGTATDVAGNSATQKAEGINIDKTAPTVTRNAAADSCAQPGTNGWCRGEQTAGFQASDALSGLGTPAQAMFTQANTIEGAAVMIGSGAVGDVAGNTNAGIGAGPFKIDKTAPAFPSPANQTVNATGPTGAAVTFSATATDTLDVAPAVTCSQASGSTFPAGATTVTCAATDQAGNTATASFTVTVKAAATQLADLTTAVTGVGPGTSLADKVQAALTAVEAGDTATACEGLRAILNEVRAQDGMRLTPAQAQQLTDDATRIRAVLACR